MHWEVGDSAIPRGDRPSAKVILVGASGVGKTCLIASYLRQRIGRKTPPTVAPAFRSCAVQRQDGSLVSLDIWDTAGQERYTSISQLFFRDSDVALVCFDPNDESSVARVRQWVSKVLGEVPSCRLFAVIRKADKIDKDQIDATLERYRREFDDLNFVEFFGTSAATRTGIDAPFAASAECFGKSGELTYLKAPAQAERSGCC
jgi:small GTP-binding protein